MELDGIVLHVHDVRRAARFWSAALDYRLRDGAEDDAPVLVPRSGAGTPLVLDEDDGTHLDLRTGGRAERDAEVERLFALGAWRVEGG